MLTIYKIRQGVLLMKKLFGKFSEKIWKNYRKTLFFLVFLGIVSVKKIVKILVVFLCFSHIHSKKIHIFQIIVWHDYCSISLSINNLKTIL